MFSTLLESKRTRQRGLASAVTSSVFHVLIVTGAVYATATGNEPEKQQDEPVTYTEIKPPEPPKPNTNEPPPPDVPKVSAPVKGFQVLNAPIEIPLVIPPINLNDRITNADDFIPKGGVAGGLPYGVARDSADRGSIKYQFEVEVVARLAPGNPEPGYPSLMRQMNQTGSVRASFVIDTNGRADMNSLRFIEATNALFSDEVRKVLPKYKFIPAEIGGQKVRMQAELPFEFTLRKGGG